MARKVFISFLGTNDYLECHYVVNGTQSAPTRFVQEALIDHYCKEWTENDDIIIFGTGRENGSYMKNWLDDGQRVKSKGLQSILKSKSLKANVNKMTIIPEGFSEEEIWQIFTTVFEKLQLHDEIYLDVTHAFRSIPMFSTILLNYAQLLKGTKLQAIHYGAFEKLGPAYEVKEMPVEQRIAPVLDLMPLVLLQEWTVAAGDFVEYGKTDGIHTLLEAKYSQLNKESKGQDNNARSLGKLDKLLLDYSESILSNKLDEIIKGSEIKDALQAVKQADKVITPAFVPLLEKIEQKIEAFKQDDLHNVFAATEWCIQHELYQNAYSILLEGIISLLLNLIKEDYKGQSVLIEVKRGTIIHAAQCFQQQKTKEECINSFNIIQKVANNAEELKSIVSKIWDILDNELANAIVGLNTKRNSYMHAGTGTNSLGRFKDLKEDIVKFNRQLKNHFNHNSD
jgi:CRISPR-associated Csx2 family protein